VKVKLFVERDGCKAGTVAEYGIRAARALVGGKLAEYYEDPPVEKPKVSKPEPAKAPKAKEH